MEEARLRRKLAVILAADVVGYSRLVAIDEDGTLRRLMEYREIFQDFVSRGRGRIFNTAGDAVLAEFDSAVEAVRTAMDIQEALKSRNALLEDKRQMVFRMGVSLGDVVEREGDLLGDGVNIAARLQALAAPGGICISRTVQEQVVNKVSIGFRDIGQQSVKNIPNPVHAFMISDVGDASNASPRALAAPPAAAAKRVLSPRFLGALGALLVACASVAVWLDGRFGHDVPAAASVTPAEGDVAAGAARSLAGTPLKPMEVPFISQEARQAIERLYAPQKGPKALAIAIGAMGMSRKAADEETAKAEALKQCESRALNGRHCVVFALGDTVVWDHPAPRLALVGPLAPHFAGMGAVDAESVPFVSDEAHRKIIDNYLKLPTPKALAVGPGRAFDFVSGGSASDDVIRRVLQVCAARAKTACLLVAIDGDAVTRVPRLMRASGLLDVDALEGLPPTARDQLLAASAGEAWYALARGAGGIFGVGTSGAGEREAMDAALAACRAQGTGTGCDISAIGPYLVRSK